MRALLKIYTFVAIFVAAPNWALANWETITEDDLFSEGTKATMIGRLGYRQFIHIQCTSSENISISFVEEGEWSDGMELVPVELVLKVDDYEKHTYKAKFYRHNADYVGLEVENTQNAKVLLIEIANAKKQLLVGFHLALIDQKWSGKMHVIGSTKASEKLMAACGIV